MAEVLPPPSTSVDRRRSRSSSSPDSPPPPRRRDRNNDRRNRSPPPRDRDYKRRLSPSPPPPYRDRRGRSPPFNKRYRRDDGGYDGRRGSPRGGYGPPDRRFGYDQYEREQGGRPGYGRYGGRSSGSYPNWDSGRGGYNFPNAANSQREGLMSYKQFIHELEDDILPSEAERRYQEYKSEYISTQKRTFFDAHKDEEWLKDKYHPTNLVSVIERRNELAQKNAKEFLLELQNGTVDLGPGFNNSSGGRPGQASNQNSDDEPDVNGKRRRNGKPQASFSAAPKAHPVSSEPRRIQLDIEQSQALVRKLDSEKGIDDNILSRFDNDRGSRDKSHGSSGPVVIVRSSSSVKGLEGSELLDTLLTYLWRIHGVDYYGLVESSEPKGFRHVRIDGKVSAGSSTGGAEWEKKLDTRWQERLKGEDPLEVMTAKEKLDSAAVEALDPYVRKIRDEKYGWKYGCGAKGCTKLFHAAEFVHKHLKLKHPELVVDLTSKLREDLYFQNYMNDADAPGGTPVMQPSLQREKPLMRRPMEHRLKDDRGIRRDRDDDKSQSMDDGTVGGNGDDLMYDSFGGQGLHVTPNFSDIAPPPVLMPVPGAGPLGPFVPAPPEVAMRMMREQGGAPLPFDGSGRNGRPGTAPIIAMPQGFRQDPRRLRSYNDLDAVEDEVTVIDYRSL